MIRDYGNCNPKRLVSTRFPILEGIARALQCMLNGGGGKWHVIWSMWRNAEPNHLHSGLRCSYWMAESWYELEKNCSHEKSSYVILQSAGQGQSDHEPSLVSVMPINFSCLLLKTCKSASIPEESEENGFALIHVIAVIKGWSIRKPLPS